MKSHPGRGFEWFGWFTEAWITVCGSRLLYEPLHGKEVVYVVPASSVLGRLPVVRAGDTGTIPFSYRTGLRNGAHRYDHDLARADTRHGAGDGCHMYFVNAWALGWSREMWMNGLGLILTIITAYYCILFWFITIHYYILLLAILLPITAYIITTSLLLITSELITTHYCI